VGDFEEVERLRAGIREWVLRTARSGRHELRDIPAPTVLALLCAAAFGPALGHATDLTSSAAVARIAVLASVEADVLTEVLGDAAERARSAGGSGEPARNDLQREISRSVGEILAAQNDRADGLRSDIAMVMREIDAGGTVFRAAIEAGNEEVERAVLAAVEAVSAEYGDMAFMLADLAAAAVEVQDRLDGQGTELRAAREKAGRQSADVRMIREELAVIERRSRHWTPAPDDHEGAGPGWTGACPYPGLLPYDQAHEPVFFGRERLTAELTGKLAETGIVMVSGGSGAGKTSLLRAGLIPALARGVQVAGSSSWPRISLTPTAHPLTELAAKLAALGGRDPAAIRQILADAPGEAHLLVGEIMAGHEQERPSQGGDLPAPRLVLIIDQFEQVFAGGSDDGKPERTAFIDAVCAAATNPAGSRREPPARVVIAVRGDYWDRCAAYPQLVRAMERDQLLVSPMPEADLRRAITGPAEVSGLRIESALTDAILADVRVAGGKHGSGVLPRLAQAMMTTWENRENGGLTAEGYDRAGRVARAVEVSAEAVYAGLPERQKAIARDVLRRMATVGHDRRPVPRPVTRTDLRAGYPKSEWSQVGAVLDAFTRSHLLVLRADVAEIAHDVLLQAWPRLRGWLTEDQNSIILHGQLAEDTATGRAATRGHWRRRTLATAVVVLLVAALAGAGLAVRSVRNTASQQRTADISGRLAAQSTALDALNPLTASLLAGAAWRVAPTAQARYSLLESLAQPVRGVLTVPSGVVTALAYGPGGTTLAAGYAGGTIRLWDLSSHHLVSTTTWGAAVLTLEFTGGGKTLEVAGAGAIGRWNLTSQPKIAAQSLADSPDGSSDNGAAAFSPDGKILATGDKDGNVRLWDTASGHKIGEPMSSDLKPVDAVAFSPDGTAVAAASSDGTVQLWDVATQREAGPAVAASSAAVKTLVFSPSGKLLATGDEDGNVRLWDVATQSHAGASMVTGDPVTALTFSATGSTLASAEGDGSTQLWNVATQHQTGTPLTVQSSGGVSAVAFSPDGGSPAGGGLATGNGDGTVRLWNPDGFHQASAPLAIGALEPPASAGEHAPAVLAANGGILAASGPQGTVRLWDPITRRPVGAPIAGDRTVKGLAVSPDGKTLAVVAGGLQLWATATGRRTGNPLSASDASGPVAFSPDGSLMATIGDDGKARLWGVATQRETGNPMTIGGPAGGQGALAFSPNGKILAAAGANGSASLWSVATQRQIGVAMTLDPQTAAGQGAAAVTFSPDGKTLAASGNGTTRLWDAATQQEIGVPMTAGSQPVYAMTFNPGATMLATASGDGTARLWDAATQQEIGAPMTAGNQPVYAVAFNPGGTMLVTASGDGTARLWDVSFPAGLLAAVCAIADQSLTRQQWADYAGTQPFQQVCPAS
jgi:WD40 repeat protein